MKIGVITDIHNNLPALDAVLDVFHAKTVDRICCCGDLIGIGPYPDETVRRLASLDNLTAVRGNHDRYFTDGMPDTFPNDERMERDEMLHHRWEHARLSDASAAFLKSLPLRAEFDADGLRVCVVHYGMDDQTRYTGFVPDPSGDDLARMFADTDADIVLYGHNHSRGIVRHNGRQYVNVGSLGCPARQRNIARAGILTISGGGASVQAIDVSYNAAAVVQEIDRLNYPSAAEIKKYFYGTE